MSIRSSFLLLQIIAYLIVDRVNKVLWGYWRLFQIVLAKWSRVSVNFLPLPSSDLFVNATIILEKKKGFTRSKHVKKLDPNFFSEFAFSSRSWLLFKMPENGENYCSSSQHAMRFENAFGITFLLSIESLCQWVGIFWTIPHR